LIQIRIMQDYTNIHSISIRPTLYYIMMAITQELKLLDKTIS